MCDICGKEKYTRKLGTINVCFECIEEVYQPLAAHKSLELTGVIQC